MILTKEEQLLLRHLVDLSRQAELRNMDVYSGFLSVRETAIFKKHLAGLPFGRFFLFGGVEEAERQIICFPASFSEKEMLSYPISTIKISVKGAKFKTSTLKHSDFLGSLIGLGIERRLLGDIFLEKEGETAYVLCLEQIADFILSSLTKVGNIQVSCVLSTSDEILINRQMEDFFGIVPSLRLDAIVSEVFHLSRAKVKLFLEGGKIILNGAEADSAHREVRNGDILSLRGYGKFQFHNVVGKTRKNNIKIHIKKYC